MKYSKKVIFYEEIQEKLLILNFLNYKFNKNVEKITNFNS